MKCSFWFISIDFFPDTSDLNKKYINSLLESNRNMDSMKKKKDKSLQSEFKYYKSLFLSGPLIIILYSLKERFLTAQQLYRSYIEDTKDTPHLAIIEITQKIIYRKLH